MYDPSVSARAIERAAAAINAEATARGLPADFSPQYHSIREVERNNQHFLELLDPETGQLRRELQDDEKRWIRNERLISQLDFYYWSSRYSWILNWEQRLQRYEPNVAQRIIQDFHAEMERDGVAIMVANLKARQVGISTDTELKVAHRVQFWPNTTAVVASSDPGKTAKMAQMIERTWNHQPWFLIPKMTGYQKGECIDFGEMDSHLILQWGNQQTGLSRGDAPPVAHLSELPDFQNPEDLIDAALLWAMHERPFTFLVLESTAKGRHNWWHKTWEYAKAHWADHRSRLRPLFLPWYTARDLYPTSAWLRAHPMPSGCKGYQPEEDTIKQAGRAKDYVASNDLLRKHLGVGWEMPREQMWFWEVTRAEYKEKGQLGIFMSELCSDDLECFVASGISVFDAEVTAFYRERCQHPVGVFGIQGPTSLIHPRFQPHKREIDPNAPKLRVDENFTLVPLRFSGVSGTSPDGKLFIWELPDENEDYGLGVDPSGGIGRDGAAIEALRKGTMHRNDAQVAEFVCNLLNAKDLVPFAYAIGRFYSPKRAGQIRQAKMAIEIEGGGNITQVELRLKYGWTRFHQWMRAYDQRILDRSRSNQLGWSTNRWSRPNLIVTLLDYINNGWLDINSPWFCDQMADFKEDEASQKLKARSGARDDRIMSLAIILFSMHDLETRTREPSVAVRRAQAADPNDAAPIWRPGDQSRSEGTPMVVIPRRADGFEPEEY